MILLVYVLLNTISQLDLSINCTYIYAKMVDDRCGVRMSVIDKAIGIAVKAHAGQVDKGGEPYILHPLRLMMKFTKDTERSVAVLHDVVEDSDITLEDLRNHGVPAVVVEAVDSLTKRDGETYEEFVVRVSLNKLASKIKIEDLKDNLDLTRMNALSEKDLGRVSRYHAALIFLSEHAG